MNLPVIRRILKEDLQRAGGEVPGWIDAFLSPLNEFIDRITLVLRNNITFKDNMAGKLQSLEFTHGQETVVNHGLRGRINGVVLLGVESDGSTPIRVDRWSWRATGVDSIGLLFDFVSLETTGNTTSGNSSLSSLTSTTITTSGSALPGILVGYNIIAPGVPRGTTVSTISGSTVTMSGNAAASINSNLIKFGPTTGKVTYFITSE